jgi:wyosine [tRNA(Phe)-imidazoG37] synthetase (radical SAM superfamily)
MLVRTVNDTEDELDNLRRALKLINADKVQVLAPTRPPTEKWVEAPRARQLAAAEKLLAGFSTFSEPEAGEIGIENFTNARDAILYVGARHPLRFSQARAIERKLGERDAIKRMLTNGELEEVVYRGSRYLIRRRPSD